MPSEKDNLTITAQWTMTRFRPENIYPVLESDWNRLSRTVKRRKTTSQVFLIVGFFLWGVATTALIGALTLSNTSDSRPIMCWAIFSSTLFCGGLSLFYYRLQRRQDNESVNDIAECIADIENKRESVTDLES
jgi:hypothetical protein